MLRLRRRLLHTVCMIFIEKCILYFTYKNNYGNDKVYCIQFAYFSYEYNRYYAGAYCILYNSTYAGAYCVLFKWGHAGVYCLLYIHDFYCECICTILLWLRWCHLFTACMSFIWMYYPSKTLSHWRLLHTVHTYDFHINGIIVSVQLWPCLQLVHNFARCMYYFHINIILLVKYNCVHVGVYCILKDNGYTFRTGSSVEMVLPHLRKKVYSKLGVFRASQRGINENPYRTGWMHWLINVFAGHTGLIVGFVVRWLNWKYFLLE